jgi:hypothetical protein
MEHSDDLTVTDDTETLAMVPDAAWHVGEVPCQLGSGYFRLTMHSLIMNVPCNFASRDNWAAL